MTQELADSLRFTFEQMTNIIGVNAKYLPKGDLHRPTALPKGMQGVYVFLLTPDCCFKVGKAGANSKARWNSHHYNLDATTPSTFAKSIIKNRNKFKEYFPDEKRSEIDGLSKGNIKDWIRNNISRIEFIFPQENGLRALNLLEAWVQYKLNPIFEGKVKR